MPSAKKTAAAASNTPKVISNTRRRQLSKSSGEAARARLVADRRRSLKKIDADGPTPSEASKFFIFKTHDFYNIQSDQVVSLAAMAETNTVLNEDEVNAARAIRDKTRIVYINAGKPTNENQDAGKRFQCKFTRDENHLWEEGPHVLTPTQLQTHRVFYVDPDGNKAKAPKETDVTIKPNAVWSEADALARFVGHEALAGKLSEEKSGLPFLPLLYDARTAKVHDADMDSEYTNEAALYEKQRDQLEAFMKKVYMVYPALVDPCIGEFGEVYAKGEIAEAYKEKRTATPLVSSHTYYTEERDSQSDMVVENKTVIEDVEGTEFEGLYAPQPVIFVSIHTDAREGKPNSKIRGFDSKERAYPLPPKMVQFLKARIDHFDLELKFPSFANLHDSRSHHCMNFADMRQKFITEIGPVHAPEQAADAPVNASWLEARTKMPFGKVWVQDFDADCPSGKVVIGSDDPILIPLKKDRARERNGHVWMNVEALDTSTPQNMQVQLQWKKAIQRYLGNTYSPNDDDGDAGSPSILALQKQSQQAMLQQVESLNRTVQRLREHNEEITTTNELITEENLKLKREKYHLTVSDGSKVIVDLTDKDATLIVRCGPGVLSCDMGNPSTPAAIVKGSVVKLKFSSEDEDKDLPPMPTAMLLTNNQLGDVDNN